MSDQEAQGPQNPAGTPDSAGIPDSSVTAGPPEAISAMENTDQHPTLSGFSFTPDPTPGHPEPVQPSPEQPAPEQPYDQHDTVTIQPQYPADPNAQPIGDATASESTTKRSNKVVATAVGVGLVAGLIGGVVGAGAVSVFRGGIASVASGTQLNPLNPEGLSPRANNSIAAIAKAVTPSVVSIKVMSGTAGATGTGFVISSDGYIMTNNHVISGAVGGKGTVAVVFDDESVAQAKLIGRSQAYDIAVIKVDKSDLKAATLGNSASVLVGDEAIAIGSPLGLEGTVTSGIISAVRRPVSAGGQGEASHISALQTDAAINPGNSGGPLVNSEGQVIGVNSSIATLASGQSGGAESGSIGLGFAIPINNAKRVADEIISSGQARVPIIGVQVNMLTPDEGGAEISGITPDGSGAKAGLQPGDRIIEIDGDRIANPAEALAVIRSHNPGDTIKVTVQSPNGSKKTVSVTLGSMVG